LAEFKQRHGPTFVLIASVFVGAVLPELFVIVFFQRGRIRLQNARNFVFNAPFWAFDGFLVNLMYRALAEWLGDRTSVPIVAAKICLDQFGYNPFFAAPFGIWGYAWKNSGYSFAKLRPLLTWQYYREHALPVLVATWAVWIPLMGYLFATMGAAISPFRPRPRFLGPHDDLHDQPVCRQDRSRRGAANFCSTRNSRHVICNSGPREMQQGFANAGTKFVLGHVAAG
jgi:hypothetical protein